MLNLQYTFENIYNKIRTLNYKIKAESTDKNFESYKNSLAYYFGEISLICEEIHFCVDGARDISSGANSLFAIKPMMYDSIKNANDLNTLGSICDSILGLFVSAFGEMVPLRLNDNLSSYDYRNNIRCSFEDPERFSDLNVKLAESLANSIKIKRNREREVNVLSTICGINENEFDATLNNHCEYHLHFYGINQLENVYCEYKRDLYDKLIYGGINNSIISNDAFDIVYCVPQIMIEREYKNNLLVKSEREYINKCTSYVRPGGIILLAIPYFRLSTEVCETLVRNYTDIQIIYNSSTFSDTYSSANYMVYIIGVKKAKATNMGTTDFNLDDYRKLRMFHLDVDRNNLPNCDVFNIEEIVLPDSVSEIRIFRGSVLDANEAEDYFAKSLSSAAFWKDQSYNKTVKDKARPLLPFSVGQLGLVLTSGCLDGIIDEGHGYKHVVKGRVIKMKDTEEIPYPDSYNENTGRGRALVVDTMRNRVEINAFLPDGTYKCLA